MFCLLSSISIWTRSQHGSMWLRYGCDFFCQVCGSRVCNDWTPIGEEWCVQLWCCVAWAPFWEKASWLHPTSWGWEHNSLGKFKTFVLGFVGNHTYPIWSSCIDSGCWAKIAVDREYCRCCFTNGEPSLVELQCKSMWLAQNTEFQKEEIFDWRGIVRTACN